MGFEKLRYDLEPEGDLMKVRAQLYEDVNSLSLRQFQKYVRFLDSTKNYVQWPGVETTNQWVVYSGFRKYHCLVL